MIKKWADILLFSGTIPLGVLFIYSVPLIFSSETKEDYFRSVSIAMLSLMLMGIIVLLLFFTKAFSIKDERGRVRSLIGKKVYTSEGDYIGVAVDVLLAENRIYGIAVKIGKRRKKVIFRIAQIKSFGEVILVNIPSERLEKL